MVVVQERDEATDRPLKIDIVFPKRVVRIDEQVLAGRIFFRGCGGHVFILSNGWARDRVREIPRMPLKGETQRIHHRDAELNSSAPLWLCGEKSIVMRLPRRRPRNQHSVCAV